MIGYVIPTRIEAQGLIDALEGRKETSVRGRTLVSGRIHGTECVVTVSGIGKVLCAAATQQLIDLHPECEAIFHLGSAGALNEELKAGDIVIAREIVSHDHVSAMRPASEKPRAHSDPALVERFRMSIEKEGGSCTVGTILSGDEDVLTLVRRTELFSAYKGLAVDWESYACAKVCNLNEVPCLVARAITDHADEDTLKEFKAEVGKVMGRLCRMATRYLLPKV